MLDEFLLTPKLLKYKVLLRESGDATVTAFLHNHAALIVLRSFMKQNKNLCCAGSDVFMFPVILGHIDQT